MARIVRPMKKDPADGKPKVGTASKCLGVRPPGDANADVEMDDEGNVKLNRMGLSVSEDWRKLPGHLLPEELADEFNGARGKGMAVFVHGDGKFEEGPVAPGLYLLFKEHDSSGGLVCPTDLVPLQRFQEDLIATRPDWVIDPGTIR